ncbi:MAG: radical SAM protein, partial [Candidatus Fermentibacteraceae bacterium]|nr:radical SAM protein [Candidatus Fermentibacteraceae bacterium]
MAGSAEISRSILLQLPLNPSAPLEDTGNVPLAGATLAAAASLPPSSLVDQDVADTMGDGELLKHLLEKDPALVAFTLYMWNAERSAWLARALKKEKPDIVTVGGGPEVSRDNEWLRREGGFDLLVAGEGEAAAADVLDPARATAVSIETGGLLQTGATDLAPGSYPNPWIEGYLDPSGRSVLLETVRGCAAGCVYCSYRRSHPHPRIMAAKDVIGLLRTFADRGTCEVVFLDPTFNARPDLAPLLRGMSGLGMEFFGEMRGDLIGPETASMIMDAGFRSVEIGLQSCNRKALDLAGRPGDPMMVLEGAMNLRRAGVKPVIDIMLGLPGDTPEDAVRTAMMLKDRGLHHDLQVFHISVLPGTALRGLCGGGAMDRPPYYMFDPPLMGGFAQAREEIADIAGYDLDLAARPILFEGWPGTVTLDLDAGPAPAV